MTQYRFQTAQPESQLILQESATLHVWNPIDRILYIQFSLAHPEARDTVMRHIAKQTQNLRITENDTIYDMIVEPHPHRATGNARDLIIRYVIQASTETKYQEEEKK